MNMSIVPLRPKGPPLNALRAFEAAARLGGFAVAAEELCVTPGAVAQHIKSLEAWAGADLFERRSRGVRITQLGAELLPEITRAFDCLGAASMKLRARASPTHIRIAALPSIAQLWLSPRLPHIRSRVPDIAISVTAMEHRPNLLREPFDLSIFWDTGDSPDGVISLDDDVMLPVCAPAVARTLNRPEDLTAAVLLHDSVLVDDWDAWLSEAAPGLGLDTRGPVFSLYSLAVEEAKNGAGVLIGHRALVERNLLDGTLVAPFDCPVKNRRRISIEVAEARKHAARTEPAFDDILRVLCS